MIPRRLVAATLAAGAAASAASAASIGTAAATTEPIEATTLTLVTYDSFPSEDDSVVAAFAAFRDETGIEVRFLASGDTGEMVTKAALTAGNPEGDVMFGIDTTFLQRALDADVFDPYEAAGLDRLVPGLADTAPDHLVTPVDIANVCLNVDARWFADHELDPPTSLDDLTKPEYEGLLVVEDPASSAPGMTFLLATAARFGDGWEDYWHDLAANDVAIAPGWSEAYYEQYSAASDGDRPIVVSYATSPAAELLYADPPVEASDAPSLNVPGTCVEVVEYAGILRGTEHPDAAARLVDFLVSPEFQATLPLANFVLPANADVALPDEFTATGAVVEGALPLPADLLADRDDHLERWLDVMGR